MRSRTRRSFAAPFVLVVGCSSGGGTPPDRAPPTTPSGAVRDAAIDAPAVAAVVVDATVKPDAAPSVPRCPGTPGPDNPCNPPRPRKIEAKIVEAHEDGGLVIQIDRGADDGIDKRWQIELRGTNGGVIPKFRGEIVRITSRSTEIRFSEKADRPVSELRAYLVAP